MFIFFLPPAWLSIYLSILIFFIYLSPISLFPLNHIAQLAWAVEYTECISSEW